MRPTQQLHEAGQSLWLDNITRALLDQGRLAQYIEEDAVTGLTSNPTIFDKAIEGSTDYDSDITMHTADGLSDEEVFYELAIADLQRAADLFAPVHARTGGMDGWVSLEVSPRLAHDTEGTIESAKKLYAQADRPNVFIKIPGNADGVPAIEECIFGGIPINVTLLFSPEQYRASAEAYLRGIERRIAAGLDPDVRSVASLFVSRWDTAVHDKVPAELRDRLGIAVAQQTYVAYREVSNSDRWLRLANEGARPQRLLWASTSTKNPDAPATLYVAALAAPFTIDTIPGATIKAFAEEGQVGAMMSPDAGSSAEQLNDFARAGIDVTVLAEQLQTGGADSFDESWKRLLACIAGKHDKLAHTKHPHVSSGR